MFSVEVTAPELEGAFSAEVIFTTQFEVSSYIDTCCVQFNNHANAKDVIKTQCQHSQQFSGRPLGTQPNLW